MSSKVAHYLQQHVLGEVTTSKDVLDYFSTDGSIFSLKPQVAVYPRNTSDVRKVARFAWQLAERGHGVPITARGKGTDDSGAAIGSGIILIFPAHMNKILELDRETVTVQPGIIYSKVEQTLHTHGRFLPAAPPSMEYSTIGGAVANNSAGQYSFKYGPTLDSVKALHVVLANGELIKTSRLSKRDLNKKKGLTSFEGEIYRSIDGLINDNWGIIQSSRPKVTRNTAGYNLFDIKHKDGSFDLTPLIVGSQGTLGIITQIIMKTSPHNPSTTMLAAFFDDIDKAGRALAQIRPLKPAAIEMVDENLLQFVKEYNPNQLRGIVNDPLPKVVMLIEFDDATERNQKRNMKKCRKVLEEFCYEFNITTDEHERETLWKIRHAAANILWHDKSGAKALPIIEDGIVPAERFSHFLKQIYKLYAKFKLDPAVWGHAGDSNFHLLPLLDLSKVGDRQTVFKLADEYYRMIIEFGGSTSADHNDGRIRAPYLKDLYGDKMYSVMKKVKKIFDPHDVLNPGVKIGVEQKDLVPLLRREYSLGPAYDHLPRL